MMTNKIEGLIAAPFTPMPAGGEINYDKIPDYYAFLQKNEIAGAFINVSTGEGVSLTQKEKSKMTTIWCHQKKAEKGLKIINLLGGTSYAECIENALMSAEAGVDAVAVLSPYYFVPRGAGELAEFCARVAESVPGLPVYFYHIPVLTGCYIPMFEFLQKAESMIPNLAGIKYTHEDFMDFQTCLNFRNKKYDMLWGRDENLLSALILGARGGVGSTFNYAAPLYHQLIHAFDDGRFEEARDLQQTAINMIVLLGKYGGISTGKAYMKYVGLDCGEFRLPVTNKWAAVFPDFEKDVQSLKMEDLFSKM